MCYPTVGDSADDKLFFRLIFPDTKSAFMYTEGEWERGQSDDFARLVVIPICRSISESDWVGL